MTEKETASGKHFRLKISYVLIILLIAGAGAFVYYRLTLKSRLQARIDTIRDAGYPVTCAELDKWYKIPSNVENAAYTIIDALSYYKRWDKEKSKSLPVVGRAKLPARTEPLGKEMKALIAQYITDNKKALELLHTGAVIKHSRYPVDLSAGFEAMRPDLHKIKTAAELLKLNAILHTENGGDELAVRSAISIFGIDRSLSNVPVLGSQIVRISCRGIAITTIEYCINRIELTDGQLTRLIDCVHNAELISDKSCTFVGERCRGLSFFIDPDSVNPDLIDGIPSHPVLELYKATGMVDTDAIMYLDFMGEYIKISQLPLHKRLEAVKAIDTKFISTSKAHILLYAMMPPLSRITTLEIRTIAQLRTASAGLAIERYRLAAGRLPDTLADLVPICLDAVPTDPFDGNDLRYKKLEAGFIVYSIGEDQIDDGGKERKQRTKESPNWDVTFIVER
jgi:hypothetical protein